MIEVRFEIEKDELKDGCYKVCIYEIRDDFRKLIGIPLRYASQDHAERTVHNLQYAFDYGFGFFLEKLNESTARMSYLSSVTRSHP